MRGRKSKALIISIILVIIAISAFIFIKRTEIAEKISFNLNQRANLGTASSKNISVSELGEYSSSSGDVGAHYLSLNDGSNVFCADLNKQLVTQGEWKTTSYEDLFYIDMRNARCPI